MFTVDPSKRFESHATSSSSGTSELDVARVVLDHAVRRMATVEKEIAEAKKRTTRVSETLLKQRDRRNAELVAACIKFDAAETARNLKNP